MAEDDQEVKVAAGPIARCLEWIDAHARTGWYVAVVVTLDFALHLLQAFG